MKTSTILLLICSLCFLQLEAGKNKDFEKKYDRAEVLFRNGNFADALKVYLDLYAEDAANHNLCYKIGVCYMKAGKGNDPARAIVFLEKAAAGVHKLYDENDRREKRSPVTTYRLLADAYHLNYEFDKAITSYQQYKKAAKPNRQAEKEISRKIAMCITGKELMACPADVKIVNLGKSINSPYPDYSPRLSADQSTMIFTSRRPENTGGKTYDGGQYFEDIYIATRQNGQWQCHNIGWPVNTVGNEAAIGISADGQEILIYKDDMGDGNIYSSRLDGEKWSTPAKLNANINSPYWEPGAFLSADGNTLYFVSDRPGGYGGTDIYKSTRKPGGDWGKAENLGPTINSPFDEHSPYIHPDGVTLFFSSRGHKTMGGYDVFFSHTLLSDDKIWLEPTNVGYPINTPGDDAFYMVSTDKQSAYYSSLRPGGAGEKDIYMVTFPDAPDVPLALQKGLVLDSNNKAARNVVITVTDNETNQVEGIYRANTKTGQYLFVLTPGKSHNISYEADGRLFYTENRYVPATNKYTETQQNIRLSDLAAGSKVTLNNIFFDFDQSVLKPNSQTELRRMAAFLKKNPKVAVEVSGYADSKGSDAYNLRLSEERAQAVVDYLAAQGIERNRMTATGNGAGDEQARLADNTGRRSDRRVELKIVKVQ